ncbi:hypothetical protein [Novosphingobium sp. B 225]|uniref:hypothetical protein n=1 Tax=Novosphingobium sp. B 225 TaxID=1961849 RepID=UPI000B4AC5F4|nr:hypothetical protein [Novosphingobium sp. B 225]
MDKFPARMFRWAAIYGVIVLLPLYFTPLPPLGAETFLGFVGLALVFQSVFWIIGSDPVKYRALMLPAVAEKLVFGLPALMLYARGYPVPPPVAVFAAIDVALGIGFYLAWRRTPS